ncbi:MAG TPA: HAD family hydrolase [Bacillota bacterium]|jgi:Cof subfamily protein (haloacid dehalogenase superfamily)|nr:HAD family hydrolase [Bacillota bacterium]HOL09091.1 HAD family hydrolase [Bacillota bacterium]HPO98031.1 HAD family hydrolase [Bacillota bacterium]
MNPSHYKMIVTDLDGTLIPYGSDLVAAETVKVITALQQQGLLFTIATGRSWRQTKLITDQLPVFHPVIVQAGAIVIDPLTGKPLRIQPLRPELEVKLRVILDSPHVDQLCLNESGLYYTTKINTKGGSWVLGSGEECCVVSELAPGNQQVIKHLFIGPELELKELITKIKAMDPTPTWILWPPDDYSEDWFLEVFDPLVSKGQALTWLVGQLGLTLEQVIAFGDGYNDLDMLRVAGLGVAIDKAPAAVRSVADTVISGPESNGVAKFLKELINSNR